MIFWAGPWPQGQATGQRLDRQISNRQNKLFPSGQGFFIGDGGAIACGAGQHMILVEFLSDSIQIHAFHAMILSTLIWIPFAAALIIGLLPHQPGSQRSRSIAAIAAGITFAISLSLLFQFQIGEAGMQLSEQLPWLDALGLTYQLGVDGVSLPLVLLNALLMGLVIYCTDSQLARPKLYYALMMLISGGIAGAFLAQDLLLFFLFYEVELIPLYLLIAIWGGAQRGYAATKFLIYTAISGGLLLLAFLGTVALSGTGSFAYTPALTQGMALTEQLVLLGLIILAFGIKIPLVPFHTWLPDAHVEASTPVSMILAGVLLKLGTYGLLRFGLGLFPEAWQVFAPWLALLAVINTLYGSLNAIVQQDMKKLVAYSSIGHMGYILLGLASATPLALSGAVVQMVSHGLISALLFLLVGFIYSRTGTRDLNVLRGLLTPERGLPLVGGQMILGVMAGSGLPGLMGFMAEFCIFRGSFVSFPVPTLLCIAGTGLTSVYFLLLVNRAFFGRLPEQFAAMARVSLVDHAPAFLLCSLIILFGVQPQWIFGWSEASLKVLSAAL
jgi:NAD(P)H-quinone oxidoreductase subunit 4